MIKINLLNSVTEKKGNVEAVEFSLGQKILSFFSKDKSENQGDNQEQAPEDNIRGDQESANAIQILIKIAVLFAGITALYLYEQDNIPKLQAQLKGHQKIFEDAKAFNSKASAIVAEIKKMKENKLTIEKQIESIGGLSRVRLKLVKVLDVIQQNIPEKMWFTSIHTAGLNVFLEGIAMSENEISTYIDLLGKNVNFSDVTLAHSEDDVSVDSNGRKLKKFKINCTMEKDLK